MAAETDGQPGRRLALTGAGVLLLVIGAFIKDGWPFMIGGFLLLIVSSRTH
jgi:hypothetical protein